MSTNWDLYEARIGILGNTQRDRNVNRVKNQINNNIIGSPSYQTVRYNNDSTDSHLVVIDTDQSYTKKINSLPDESFNLGDYVTWQGNHWLITEIDGDITIHTSGEMQLCNYLLKFIDSNGAVVSRWCIVGNSSGTVQENTYMRLPDGKYSIKLGFDGYTSALKLDDRFLIDYGTATPQAYKIERIDRVVNHFGNSGVIELTVGQDELNTADDSVVNMVANYNSKYKSSPTHSSNYAEISYTYDPILKVGSGSKKFTVLFKDEDGVLLSPQPSPVWTLDNDSPYLITSATSNYILIKAIDISLVGSSITLTVKDQAETMETSVELDVMPLG